MGLQPAMQKDDLFRHHLPVCQNAFHDAKDFRAKVLPRPLLYRGFLHEWAIVLLQCLDHDAGRSLGVRCSTVVFKFDCKKLAKPIQSIRVQCPDRRRGFHSASEVLLCCLSWKWTITEIRCIVRGYG